MKVLLRRREWLPYLKRQPSNNAVHLFFNGECSPLYSEYNIMAKFNADSFLNQTVEAKLSVKRIPMPEDDHDGLQVRELEIKSGTVKEGDNAGKVWVRLNVKMVNTDPNVAEEMKLSGDAEPTIYWNEFLDLDDDGNLDVADGKNIKLGKLRQALGQNTDEGWTMNDMKGATCGGRVKHKFNAEGDAYAVLTTVYNPEGDVDEDEE